MSRAGEWNTLLDKMRYVAFWFHGFIASLEKI